MIASLPVKSTRGRAVVSTSARKAEPYLPAGLGRRRWCIMMYNAGISSSLLHGKRAHCTHNSQHLGRKTCRMWQPHHALHLLPLPETAALERRHSGKAHHCSSGVYCGKEPVLRSCLACRFEKKQLFLNIYTFKFSHFLLLLTSLLPFFSPPSFLAPRSTWMSRNLLITGSGGNLFIFLIPPDAFGSSLAAALGCPVPQHERTGRQVAATWGQ